MQARDIIKLQLNIVLHGYGSFRNRLKGKLGENPTQSRCCINVAIFTGHWAY